VDGDRLANDRHGVESVSVENLIKQVFL
jgi:hypothetical protein